MSRTFLKNIKIGFIPCASDFILGYINYFEFLCYGYKCSVDIRQIYTHRLQIKIATDLTY